MSDWTPEQIDNIMAYGKCPVCGSPRERYQHVEVVNGVTEHTMGIRCPEGHTFEDCVENLDARLDNVR